MRLICGLLSFDGDADTSVRLRALIGELDVPRLRPALTSWTSGPVGMAVLDFSERGATPGPLPISGNKTLAADVRLDAFEELRQSLGCAPDISADNLLLEMLVRRGSDCLPDVLGDFAFACWDEDKQSLLCGRDIFGVRPFAYAYKPGTYFAFASLPKALHGSGIVPKALDEDAVIRRISRQFGADDSLVAGIRRLPPAHVLEVSRDGLTVSRYWQLDRSKIGTRSCSPDEAARELRKLVEEAVACRLPRSGRIGAHLSGGLDSSSIAVLAARRLRSSGRSLHAYSLLDRLRNDVTLEDETEFVKAVLDQEGDIDWTPVRPPVDLGVAAPVEADNMMAESEIDPESSVCARAEQQGVELILSGWGGDEGATFNGRGAFAELLRRGHWQALAREIAAVSRERGWPLYNIISSEILHNLLPDAALAMLARVRGRRPAHETEPQAMLSPDARRKLLTSPDRKLTMTGDGRENRWRLMSSPHISERAEIWAQTGARHGLAFAFPLLDRRVVEFSLSLPSSMFWRDGVRRRPFRDAMVDVLPDKVRDRHAKYQSFPGTMVDLAESKNEFLAQIDDYRSNEAVGRLIDLQALRRLVEGFPSPDLVREEMQAGKTPEAARELVTAFEIMAAAAYIAQHAKPASRGTAST